VCVFVAFLTLQIVDADVESITCPLPGLAGEKLPPLREGACGVPLGGGLPLLTEARALRRLAGGRCRRAHEWLGSSWTLPGALGAGGSPV